MLTLITLTAWCGLGFPTVRLLFPPCYTPFVRREPPSPAHTQCKGRQARFLEGEPSVTVYYLEFLFGEILSLLPHSFSYLIMYLYHCGLMNTYCNTSALSWS